MGYMRQRNPRILRALFQVVCIVDTEFLAPLLILEYLVQLTDLLKSRLCHGLVIWTQPDQHVARILVDVVPSCYPGFIQIWSAQRRRGRSGCLSRLRASWRLVVIPRRVVSPKRWPAQMISWQRPACPTHKRVTRSFQE